MQKYAGKYAEYVGKYAAIWKKMQINMQNMTFSSYSAYFAYYNMLNMQKMDSALLFCIYFSMLWIFLQLLLANHIFSIFCILQYARYAEYWQCIFICILFCMLCILLCTFLHINHTFWIFCILQLKYAEYAEYGKCPISLHIFFTY